MRSLGQSRSNHLESRLQNHYEQGLDLGGGGVGGVVPVESLES